jgi:hypothetical protein
VLCCCRTLFGDVSDLEDLRLSDAFIRWLTCLYRYLYSVSLVWTSVSHIGGKLLVDFRIFGWVIVCVFVRLFDLLVPLFADLLVSLFVFRLTCIDFSFAYRRKKRSWIFAYLVVFSFVRLTRRYPIDFGLQDCQLVKGKIDSMPSALMLKILACIYECERLIQKARCTGTILRALPTRRGRYQSPL